MPSVITPCGGNSSSGIQFDTYPQAGQWLYVETDGAATSPSGFGIEIFDHSGNGINLATNAGGQILLSAAGGGAIHLQQQAAAAYIVLSGRILLQSAIIDVDTLPTSDPGVTGRLWNNGGVVNVSL